jgi:hypothetical protein
MSIVDARGLALLEQLIGMATGRSSAFSSGYGLGDLYVSDRAPQPSPHIEIWTCQRCNKNYYGRPLVNPNCPDCDAPLVHTDTWDLRVDAFRPFRGERWGVR